MEERHILEKLTDVSPGMEIWWEQEFRTGEDGIILEDNPLESPPVEIIEQGTEAIKWWFESLEEEGERRE